MIDRHTTSGRAVSAHNYSRLQPLLAESRKRVYDGFRALCRTGGSVTLNEVIVWMKDHGQDDNDLDSRGASARTCELIRRGLLKVTGKVTDPISGVMARTYKPVPEAEAVPVQLFRPTRKQLEQRLAALEEQRDQALALANELYARLEGK